MKNIEELGFKNKAFDFFKIDELEDLEGCTSVLLFYIANIAGNATNNKLLLSSDIVSTILFGLFLLFI